MYELMRTERRIMTYPRALRELMHHDFLEALDLDWLYKRGAGLPLVIHQPDSTFSGNYEVEVLFATKSYLPAFLFDHQILNREETEMMVRIILDEANDTELAQVRAKLASHDTMDIVRFPDTMSNRELVNAAKDLFYNFDESLHGNHFYDLFEDTEMDYKINEFLPEHVRLRDELLRISYLAIDFTDSGYQNMVSYFCDSYESQLQNAQAESDPHTTYRLVYKEYEEQYPSDETDATCVLINPIRGGGFSCTNS